MIQKTSYYYGRTSMNMNQIKNICITNGLNEFKVTSHDDLIKVHGIDVLRIEGYSTLSLDNKVIFDSFIINFFNAWGLEQKLSAVGRVKIISIYLVYIRNSRNIFALNIKMVSLNNGNMLNQLQNGIEGRFLMQLYTFPHVLKATKNTQCCNH
jgi:uncharacterized membrane protein